MTVLETAGSFVVPVVLEKGSSTERFDRGSQRLTEWVTHKEKVYRCEILLQAEDDGRYSVSIPQLPGVVSEGDTQQEAVDNIREALAAAIETYRDSGQMIPWQEPTSSERPLEQWWIVVHV